MGYEFKKRTREWKTNITSNITWTSKAIKNIWDTKVLNCNRMYLQDICDCIGKIKGYTEGVAYHEFVQDTKTLDAVTHNLLIIGEATKKIPADFQKTWEPEDSYYHHM